VKHSETEATIRVSDNGQGITPEFLPFVFDRFRQADSTTTRRHGGLGLGLAIVRHLVEIHGGTVSAESSGSTQGSTFTVRLPVVSAKAPPPQTAAVDDYDMAAVRSDVALDGLRVLVVDDDQDTLEMIGAALSDAEAQVIAAGSVEEALSSLRTGKPDIIVSDIAMPVQDGYELIKQVRSMKQNGTDIPAVAMTAYAREEDRQRALSAGFQVYLPKPVEPMELIAILAKLSRTATNGKPE
jgi:CheY-like chemotaxis protein